MSSASKLHSTILKRRAAMSVLHPNSKRRQASKGIKIGEQEDKENAQEKQQRQSTEAAPAAHTTPQGVNKVTGAPLSMLRAAINTRALKEARKPEKKLILSKEIASRGSCCERCKFAWTAETSVSVM
jgi:hypothetical protein